MTIASNVNENKELSIDEELALIQSKKSPSKADLQRAMEIQAIMLEIAHSKDKTEAVNKLRKTQVKDQKVLSKGDAKGMTITKF